MNSRREVLSEAARRQMFLSPEAMELIMSKGDPPGLIRMALQAVSNDRTFVTREDIENVINGDAPAFKTKPTLAPHNKFCSDIKIIEGTDITGNSTCEGTIDDFARYFQSRYNILKRIIERNRRFGSMAMPIEKAVMLDREVHIVGMINSTKWTENKHLMIDIEDIEGGTCLIMIKNDSPLISGVYVPDQVIGIIGRPIKHPQKDDGGRERKGLIIADEIINPDVPANNHWEDSDSQSVVGFLSDVHIGSYTFLDKNWKKMIGWLKRNAEDINLNYIVFPGDVVDGIGVFPGQEEELNISDIYDQYDALAEYLKDIPDHIKMVIHPGNHDACRPAEPQPALDRKFLTKFDSNVQMTGNPIWLNIEGRKLLTYHGRSIDDWVSGVQQLTYENPIAVMEQMLTMRHIAPMYGQKTALAPEKKDYLAMEIVPDIFVSGHVHGAGTEEYKGVKLIQASTWQDQTEYQKMHNFNPDPGIMPIVHLGSGAVKMMSFMDD